MSQETNFIKTCGDCEYFRAGKCLSNGDCNDFLSDNNRGECLINPYVNEVHTNRAACYCFDEIEKEEVTREVTVFERLVYVLLIIPMTTLSVLWFLIGSVLWICFWFPVSTCAWIATGKTNWYVEYNKFVGIVGNYFDLWTHRLFDLK